MIERMASTLGLEGIEAIVFRTVGDQPTLWESILPEELLRLPEELARVDALLDDPVFFAPFVAFFDPRIGRPSIPMETYLRLMFLKFRYRLGYESLCREVSTRSPGGGLPDPAGWVGAASDHVDEDPTRCGAAAVDGLNEALLAKAAEAKLLRTNKVRADTTVVPANVAYPTDSGLLAKAIRRIAVTGRRIKAAGGATRTKVAGPVAGRRARRAHSIGAKLRTAPPPPRTRPGPRCAGSTANWPTWPGPWPPTPNGCWPTPSEHSSGHVRRPSRCARGEHDRLAGGRRGRLARAVNDLTELLAATRQIAAQTRQRMSGETPDGDPSRVSLHDPDARPIAKGRLGKPVEFGHKAQVVDNEDGIVVDHTVEQGNPPDAPQLAPAVQRLIKRTGRKPRTVTADRGYGEKSVDDALHDLGVSNRGDPTQGQTLAATAGARAPPRPSDER